jgi:hypothetical protein
MKRFLAAIILPFLVFDTFGQTPEPSPPKGMSEAETTKVLEAIAKVQREFAKTKKELLANALERYKAAAASDAQALDFYLACYRVVNLDRKPATSKAEQDERASGEWKKKAMTALGDGASSAMLRMQIQMLVLLIESANAKTQAGVVTSLREFMQAVAAYLPTARAALDEPPARHPVAVIGKKSKREEEERAAEKLLARKKTSVARHLRQSVISSIFAEAYNLGSYIEPPAQWPKSPTDFKTAYQDVILPWYRDSKKTELPAAWDEYLKAETTLQQISLSDEALLEWGANEYADLYWAKWLDLVTNGVNAPAAALELVKIINEHPTHKSLKTWVADLAKVAGDLGGVKADEAPEPVTKP